MRARLILVTAALAVAAGVGVGAGWAVDRGGGTACRPNGDCTPYRILAMPDDPLTAGDTFYNSLVDAFRVRHGRVTSAANSVAVALETSSSSDWSPLVARDWFNGTKIEAFATPPDTPFDTSHPLGLTVTFGDLDTNGDNPYMPCGGNCVMVRRPLSGTLVVPASMPSGGWKLWIRFTNPQGKALARADNMMLHERPRVRILQAGDHGRTQLELTASFLTRLSPRLPLPVRIYLWKKGRTGWGNPKLDCLADGKHCLNEGFDPDYTRIRDVRLTRPARSVSIPLRLPSGGTWQAEVYLESGKLVANGDDDLKVVFRAP